MPGDYVLYTVTGIRDTYYAAVHWESGRAWTAPTKEGASRQAREAGLHDFSEKTISKDQLLRELGIGGNRTLRPSTSRTAPAPASQREEQNAVSDSGTWFIPGSGDATDIAAPPLPRVTGRNKLKPGGARGNPFTAGQPIGPPPEPIAGLDDDVLILPPGDHPRVAKAPFCDQATPLPEEREI